MNILLINIDSKIPNLALKKIERYHKDRGDQVTWDIPLMKHTADKIYVSCIFTKNRDQCKEWEGYAEIGGSGYDLKKKLPQEIDNIKLHINWGFTSRGCIRNCHFCFVPEMEGKIHAVGDIYDLWDGKSKDLVIMDNNILASPRHFLMICAQLRKEKIKVDFNQGLDIRLLNSVTARELKTIRHKEYKFAWDGNEALEDKFKYAYEHLKRCTVYVLAGFLSWERTMEKLLKLKEIGHVAYLMRHESIYKEPRYIQLARWVNQHHIFRGMTFEQFLTH